MTTIGCESEYDFFEAHRLSYILGCIYVCASELDAMGGYELSDPLKVVIKNLSAIVRTLEQRGLHNDPNRKLN